MAGKILIMTDLHLVPRGKRIIGINTWKRFDRALTHALARHPDAERLIVTGDLVHKGGQAEYERLAARLGEVPVPVHLMLGNHDRREAFRLVFGGQGFAQEIVDSGDDRLILLDTLDADAPGHGGRLDPEQVEWFAAALAGAGSRRVSVFMHHPPVAIGYPGMDAIMLHDADGFLDMAVGRVSHIFCGHVHRTISGSVRGIGLTMLKATAHQTPLLLDSLDTSLSVDEPGAYGVALFTPGAIIVHSEDFDLSVIPGNEASDHAL